MKLSEAITRLQELKEQYGDIELRSWSYDGQLHPAPTEGFEFSETKCVGYESGTNEWDYVNVEPFIFIQS